MNNLKTNAEVAITCHFYEDCTWQNIEYCEATDCKYYAGSKCNFGRHGSGCLLLFMKGHCYCQSYKKKEGTE